MSKMFALSRAGSLAVVEGVKEENEIQQTLTTSQSELETTLQSQGK